MNKGPYPYLRRRDQWLDLFFDILRALAETHQDSLTVRELTDALKVNAHDMTLRRMLHYQEEKGLVTKTKKKYFYRRLGRWNTRTANGYTLTIWGRRIAKAWRGAHD